MCNRLIRLDFTAIHDALYLHARSWSSNFHVNLWGCCFKTWSWRANKLRVSYGPTSHWITYTLTLKLSFFSRTLVIDSDRVIPTSWSHVPPTFWTVAIDTHTTGSAVVFGITSLEFSFATVTGYNLRVWYPVTWPCFVF